MPDQCSRWIAVCVDMLDHPIVGMNVLPPKPADATRHAQVPAMAWLDLIANAAWRPHSVRHKDTVVTLQRGEFLAGRSYWAKRWNWGEQATRSFFARLADNEMIAISNQSCGHLANVATICNYDVYQSAKAGEQPVAQPVANQSLTRGQPEPNQNSTSTTIIKKDLLSEASSDDMQPEPSKTTTKGSRKRQPYPADFEAWWIAYPDRTNNSKPKAASEWAKLTDDERLAAMASLKTFSTYCKANRDYRCVHAERYLRDRRFEAHVEAPAAKAGGPWWRDPERLAQMTPDRWRKGISEFANGIWPTDKLGPPPRHAGCVVPKALVDELKLAETYDEYGCNKHGH